MILVTGGTGFVGSYIIKQLVEKGYAVRALRRKASKLPLYIPEQVLNKVEWVEGDVLDTVSLEEAMTGVDKVIHSAAIISFSRSDKKKMYKINIEGTANTVNIALEKNIKRLVHISSVAALGRTPGGDPVNEEKKWLDNKINTSYAISKHRSEIEVWRAMAEGLNAVILNPSTVIGYGDWNSSSSKIFKTIYDEFPWYTTGINGFVDVEDVARTALLLMESNINAERFIVNGDNWSFQQLFNSIADAFEKKQPAYRATPFLGEIAWRIEKLKSFFTSAKPLLTKESAAVAQSKTYFDNKKILLALPGFSFTPLEESIRNACKNYLSAINRVQP
ncbi:MAG: NAD-dependent epimerase/dehydratase [Chitinophagaceae bacterium]|nr:NAD-dependent epimerase/dehydratase [Chitinophagaceae bacterium]